MTIVLNLRQDLEKLLREKAAQDGINPEAFALKLLEDQLATKSVAELPDSELVLEAARGLPESAWKRHQELIDLQQTQETLDDVRHRELVELNELIEATHARRMEYVAELARRRGVELRDVMDELGFPNYGRV
jgi:hypothetical protein